MLFLDTNEVLRAVLADHADHSPRAAAVLRTIASGRMEVYLTANVLFEVAFVLHWTFKVQPRLIRGVLLDLLALDAIHAPDRPLLRSTLDFFVEHNIPLGDAHNVATVEREGITAIGSFDRHVDRILGIERVEP